MTTLKLGFIGGGNMARSLIGGLIASGITRDQLSVSDRHAATRTALAADFAIHIHEQNQAIVDDCDVIVLAVKPQALKAVATELQTDAMGTRLFVTIAAGVPIASLCRWLGNETAIVRAMPNTPALVQSGATGLYASAAVSEEQRNIAESIMRTVGLVQWIEDESLMDSVTALSGSGPAYFFLVMEALEQAGRELGLPADTARLLTVQTALGAAKLALEANEDPAVLRQRVTSPGGTTAAALTVLQQGELSELFARALHAARDRAVALATELDP